NSGVTWSWQPKRLLAFRGDAVVSSIASSSSAIAFSSGRYFSFTYTWQVAHWQLPPHSATIPSTSFCTAPSMTVSPTGTSMVREVPESEIYVILGMLSGTHIIAQHTRGCLIQYEVHHDRRIHGDRLP